MRLAKPYLMFIALISLLVSGVASAAPIDRFSINQSLRVVATPGGATVNGSVESPGILGGARTVVLAAKSDLPGRRHDVEFGGGIDQFGHSQGSGVSASTVIIWDGDTIPAVNPTGLGGFDFTSDGADSFLLQIVDADIPARDIIVQITVYQNDPSGDIFSRGAVSVRAIQAANGLIPFSSLIASGPRGAADLRNVGAITIRLNGDSAPNSDLDVSLFGTNGVCTEVPPTQRLFVDECGVCNGDNSTCLDCAGVPNGLSVIDECGVCGGTGQGVCGCDLTIVQDECGVCGGDNSTCLDCAGVPNGTAVVDQCGVCGGDNSTCADCTGRPNGRVKVDECGVCGGDSTTCADCSGVPNGNKVLDACGVCDGTGQGECGCDLNVIKDPCGVCGGDGSTCVSTECVVTSSTNPYEDLKGFGANEFRLLKRAIKGQLKKRNKKKGVGDKEFKRAQLLLKESKQVLETLPQSVSTFSGDCVCASSNVDPSLEKVESLGSDYRRLMNRVVKQLKKTTGKGVCEGTEKECRKRLRDRIRLFNSFKTDMRKLSQERRAVVKAAPNVVNTCSEG